MTEARLRIRANRSTGELEVEGSEPRAIEWWEKLWPDVGGSRSTARLDGPTQPVAAARAPRGQQLPAVFGEFFSEFRSDVTDVDKVLIAGAFSQEQDAERVFTTKAAKQLLMDQSIKVANASESVRRLKESKRVFAVSEGKFRVSAGGAEHLQTLKSA